MPDTQQPWYVINDAKVLPADIPIATFREVVVQTQATWKSRWSKLDRSLGTTNASLVPFVVAIISQLGLMFRTACQLANYPATSTYIASAACLISIECIERQCERSIQGVWNAIRSVPEWGPVPKYRLDELRAFGDELQKQRADAVLLLGAIDISQFAA